MASDFSALLFPRPTDSKVKVPDPQRAEIFIARSYWDEAQVRFVMAILPARDFFVVCRHDANFVEEKPRFKG